MLFFLAIGFAASAGTPLQAPAKMEQAAATPAAAAAQPAPAAAAAADVGPLPERW